MPRGKRNKPNETKMMLGFVLMDMSLADKKRTAQKLLKEGQNLITEGKSKVKTAKLLGGGKRKYKRRKTAQIERPSKNKPADKKEHSTGD
jgi:hypothetical protein